MILDKKSMTHHDVAERGNGHGDQPDNDYGNRECDSIPDVDGNSDCDDDPESGSECMTIPTVTLILTVIVIMTVMVVLTLMSLVNMMMLWRSTTGAT